MGAFLRVAGAGLLASASVVAVNLEPHDFPHLPPTAVYLYPVVPIVVALACAARWGGQLYYAAATFGALVWGAGYGWQGYRQLRELIVGLDKIAWGGAFFLLAAILSLAKAGIWTRWCARRRATV